jgi:4-amino-4-deoxy-L-arabinose transferase-like glycosyltransferase
LPRIARRHLYLSFVALAISAPWYAYAFYTHENFMARFFLHDNIGRFANAIQGHSGSLIYYIPVLVLGMFPWSCFLIASLLTGRKNWRWPGDAGMVLLLLWIIVPLLVLSLSATKLPHYLLIIFPALACLTGRFLRDAGREARRAFKVSVVATALLTVLITGGLFAVGHITARYDPARIVFPFIALFGFLLVAVASTLQGRLLYARSAILLAAAFFFVGLSLISVPYVDSFRVMRPIALAVKYVPGPRAEVYRYGVSAPSLFFYSGRHLPAVKKGRLDEILSRPESVYIVTRKDRFLQARPKSAFTIITEKDGFSENGGPMTLLLISNRRQR